MSMYTRCVRRAVILPKELPRTRLPQALRRRCLATVEPQSTAAETPPPPSFAEATSSSASRTPTSTSTSRNVDSIDSLDSLTPSDALMGVDSSPKFVAKTPEENVRRELIPSCGIYVIPESKLLNMPSMFSLVREIEKQYGRIREFRILRDKDSPSNYLKAIFINFNDRRSMQKIQETFHGERSGTIMVGAIPAWDRAKELEGGVGFADIQHYLRPADEQNKAVIERNEEDTQMEKEVDNVEEVIKSSEAQTEETTSSSASSPAPFSSCECRVHILEHEFAMKPILHLRPLLFGKRNDRRIHLNRAFIRWGGFYPQYRFAPTTYEEDEFVIDGKIVTDAKDLTMEELKRFVEVRDATRAMRDSLVRSRVRLRDIGDLDHGLEKRNGVTVVLDWEKERAIGYSHDADSLHEEDVVADVQTKSTPIGANQEQAAKAKRNKPKKLTPEEEEGVERILQRARALRQPQQRVEVASTPPTFAETESVRETTKSATSSSSTESQPQHEMLPTPTPPSQTLTPSTPASVGSSTSQGSAIVQEAESKLAEGSADHKLSAANEALNNRERRVRRKALEEEEKARASFKVKLLGWLGR